MIENPSNTELLDNLRSEVHAWYCLPESISDETRLSRYRSILSAGEIERYHRFYFEKDKHSYLVSHALLRSVLSSYVGVAAPQLQFTNNEHGKPELLRSPGMPEINFNLTHADGLCACIITLDKACGIDAENIHRKNKLEAVARRMFADEELQLLDENNIQQQFYYYWTLREAYVKALGTGLSGSSKDFYFAVDLKDMTAGIHRHVGQRPGDDSPEGGQWQFRLYQPSSEHVLAVAYESRQPVQVKLAELIP